MEILVKKSLKTFATKHSKFEIIFKNFSTISCKNMYKIRPKKLKIILIIERNICFAGCKKTETENESQLANYSKFGDLISSAADDLGMFLKFLVFDFFKHFFCCFGVFWGDFLFCLLC